jgi:hypothetical protein
VIVDSGHATVCIVAEFQVARSIGHARQMPVGIVNM